MREQSMQARPHPEHAEKICACQYRYAAPAYSRPENGQAGDMQQYIRDKWNFRKLCLRCKNGNRCHFQ